MLGERRAIDGRYRIDGIRTRLAVLENRAPLSQEVEAGEPGHALACVLLEAWPSQWPLPGCITNNQGGKRRINPPSCLQSGIYTAC